MNVKSKRCVRGGKRPGSGRKKGTPNKSTFQLKQAASVYGEEVIKKLINVVRDSETPVNVTVSACRELLDRGFGRPALHIEQEINTRVIPWEELRAITEKSLAMAEEKHRTMIEGRAERLGITIPYISDPL